MAQEVSCIEDRLVSPVLTGGECLGSGVCMAHAILWQVLGGLQHSPTHRCHLGWASSSSVCLHPWSWCAWTPGQGHCPPFRGAARGPPFCRKTCLGDVAGQVYYRCTYQYLRRRSHLASVRSIIRTQIARTRQCTTGLSPMAARVWCSTSCWTPYPFGEARFRRGGKQFEKTVLGALASWSHVPQC